MSTQWWAVDLFYWSKIAFQCGVSFYHTMKGISSMHAYVPSPLDLAPTSSPPPSHPLGHHGTLSWAPCAMQPLPTSYLFNTRCCIYVSPLPIHLTFPFSPCPQCSFSMCLYCCSALAVDFWQICNKMLWRKTILFSTNDTAKSGFPYSL